jgi:hypothetical protein
MNSTKENPDNSFIPIEVIKEFASNALVEHVEEWMSGHREISNNSLIFLASCNDDTDLKVLNKNKVIKRLL